MASLSHLGPSVLPPNSFTRFPKLCLMFGRGSLHLFLSVAGWSLSKDSYARFLSASIMSIINNENGLVLAHGMGLKLGQSLVDNSLSLCSIFVPAHLVGKTHFGF